MNKELREAMEYLITCDDKSITPDVRDDVKMTLDYIDELQQRIDKAIEYIEKSKLNQLDTYCKYLYINYDTGSIEHLDDLLDILIGEDNE